ncbi:S-layer homology domain-containing protein [Paenibacillus sp. KQZ6P-2]|uniref:S-layer homology domain-containing protein n=1 Tax=Paenibacillus mangrovi TaxID=2931978 RepID=A0A9X1WR35_9BACL|nr:YcdB/YcdC domain-containing protein [Paenibacillus mangrovi]MCJ8012385.1 S-layer homology domain-containing protein [Paenibacillus mangrovi]
MKKGNISGRQAYRGNSTKKVAKTVLAGTLGLGLLQVPVWAAGAEVSNSGTNFATVQVVEKAAAADQTKGNSAKITKEQAAQKMLALFPDLKDAKLDDTSYSENENMPGNQSVWTLNWTFTKGNSSHTIGTTVDAITGDVLSYYKPYFLLDDDKAYYPPEITKEQAEKLAKDFVAKAAPSISAEKLIPMNSYYNSSKSLFGPVMYNFNYNVKVNGIPSDGENIRIEIDGKGRVNSYNRMTFALNYPSSKPAISLSQATDAYKKDLSLSLAYVAFNEYMSSSNAKKDWRLEYIPSPYLTVVDANTGKRHVSTPDTEYVIPKVLEYTALPSSASKPFTPHQGSTLSSEEALKLYADIAPSSKDYTLSSNLSSYWMDGKQVWNLNWNKRNSIGFPSDSISMTIDANTGQLIGYYINSYPMMYNTGETKKSDDNSKNNTAVISESKAREKAIGLVQRYYPDAAKYLKISNESGAQKSDGKTSYRYVFQQFYKDLPVYGHQVMIVLEGDGKLRNYNASLPLSQDNEKELDALSVSIKSEDALKAYQKDLGAELRYTSDGGYYTESSKYVEPTVTLSYIPTYNGERSLPFLNAVTGKSEVNGLWGSNDTGSPVNLPSDAVSHSASKDLATLLEYKVIAPGSDGLIHPDADLTYGDLLDMISKAVYPDHMYYDSGRLGKQYKDVTADSPYAEAVQMFSDRGWLQSNPSTELHPEQKLTREKLAETIVKVLHYDRLSKYFDTDPTVMSLSDATAIQNKGSVEIMIKLGLMSAKDGKFEPAKTVTKAEAAQILVHLAHIQGKVDTPISGYR